LVIAGAYNVLILTGYRK